MGPIIVAVLIAAAALAFTLFVRAQDLPAAEPVPPTQYLEERKARIYENLRDLQFEYRIGKLSDDDYQKTKQSLQRDLAATLAEIDAMQGKGVATASPAAPPPPKPDGRTCPHCGTKFPQPMKFCGSCGKAMA